MKKKKKIKQKNIILRYRKIREKMWEEYEQIKKFRRPTVIVFVVNIELYVNELLLEYNKKSIITKTSDLRKKATGLFKLGIIDIKTRQDLGTIWDIRNHYAHGVIIDKKEDDEFFKDKVKNLKNLSRAVPKTVKSHEYDKKFGHVCKYFISGLTEAYLRKKFGEHTFLFPNTFTGKF